MAAPGQILVAAFVRLGGRKAHRGCLRFGAVSTAVRVDRGDTAPWGLLVMRARIRAGEGALAGVCVFGLGRSRRAQTPDDPTSDVSRR